MKKILSVLLVISVAGQFSWVSAKEDSMKLYVSQEVTENGDGSINSPFNSMEAAREAIRQIKKNGNYPKEGITVNVRGGSYFLTDGFNLTIEDSGTEEAPVTWCAYPGEEVKLIGGAEIKLGDCQPVTDSFILSKMDSSVAGKVYEINLKDNGIDGYGDLYVTGHASYYTRTYGITEGELPTPAIYYNGEYMPLAQYPNSGEYMTIEKRVKNGEDMEKWHSQRDDPNRTKAPEPDVFSVSDDRIKRWENADQAWLFGYWKWDWSDQTMPIDKIDVENKTITPGVQSYYQITPGQRFYIFNLIEELDAPGEWFYDNSSGMLYLYPLDNNPSSSMILSFSEKPVINLNKTENVIIRDLEITGTRNCGINASSCNNVSLSYLSINKLSGEGIVASGTNLRIEGCNIYEIGKKGIDIKGGDRNTLTPCNSVVFNNCIHDFGQILTTYEGAIRYTGCVGLTIKNNLMYNGSHLAVTPGGNDNIFEYNEIHSVLKTASDMGAIYTNLGMTQRGNVYRYNSIHDCYSQTSQDWQVQAIYFDNSSSGGTVYGNLIYNIGGDGIFINGGRDNVIYHNIFANVEDAVYLPASGRNVSWGWYQSWLDGTRNYGIKGNNTVPFNSEIYAKYPHMNGILDDDPPSPKYNIFRENVAYKSDSCYKINPMTEYGTELTMDDMYNMNEIDEGFLTVKDVGFKNISNDDYSLNDDSEIYEKYPEFEKIDSTRIGLITSQLKGLLSKDSVAFAIGKPTSYVNWERKLIDENNIDVAPFIENNTAYVPVRFLSEALGATVEWRDDRAYIDLNGSVLTFTPNSMTAEYEGGIVDLPAPMIIRNGRIFVPLRAVSELFNKKVFWNDCGLVVVSGYNIADKMNEDRIYDLYNRM